jgi:hypothetical protein
LFQQANVTPNFVRRNIPQNFVLRYETSSYLCGVSFSFLLWPNYRTLVVDALDFAVITVNRSRPALHRTENFLAVWRKILVDNRCCMTALRRNAIRINFTSHIVNNRRL